MAEEDKKLIPMERKRYEEFAKRIKAGETLKDNDYWELFENYKTDQGKLDYKKTPNGIESANQRKRQSRRIAIEKMSDVKKEKERKAAEKINESKKKQVNNVNKKLVPPEMSVERYRELIGKMNEPSALGNKEIESITNHWKDYSSKKNWGKQEELADETKKSEESVVQPKSSEKTTSTQDVSKEEVKKRTEDVGVKEKTTSTQSVSRENVQKSTEDVVSKKKKSSDLNNVNKEAAESTAQKSTQDLVREATQKRQQDVVKTKGKSVIENVDVPKVSPLVENTGAATPFQKKIIKNAPKIMKGAALFIGATSLLSTALASSDKAEEKAQVRQMERNAKKKVKEEEKKRKDHKIQNAYGKIDTSEIVMEMFEQRIGHHKMGNSRF